MKKISPRIEPRPTLKVMILSALIIGVLGSVDSSAGILGQRDMAGGRVGVWVNTGDVGFADAISGVSQQVSNANLYGDLFYSHPFSNFFRADVGLGVSNRSDITATANSFTGAINIYPIQLALRVYPLGGLSLGKLYPYALGGIGLYIGSQTGSSFRSRGSSFGSKTATDLNYVVGGGIDLPVAQTIALTVAAKIYKIDFGADKFLGLRDYSGYSITFGAAYLFPLGGDKDK